MAKTVFRSTSFTLRHLVDNIRGDVALPELQRPFVWSNSKVRDLFDSMYRGFRWAICSSGRPARRSAHGRSASMTRTPVSRAG
jgi:hypothetical protein